MKHVGLLLVYSVAFEHFEHFVGLVMSFHQDILAWRSYALALALRASEGKSKPRGLIHPALGQQSIRRVSCINDPWVALAR